MAERATASKFTSRWGWGFLPMGKVRRMLIPCMCLGGLGGITLNLRGLHPVSLGLNSICPIRCGGAILSVCYQNYITTESHHHRKQMGSHHHGKLLYCVEHAALSELSMQR